MKRSTVHRLLLIGFLCTSVVCMAVLTGSAFASVFIGCVVANLTIREARKRETQWGGISMRLFMLFSTLVALVFWPGDGEASEAQVFFESSHYNNEFYGVGKRT